MNQLGVVDSPVVSVDPPIVRFLIRFDATDAPDRSGRTQTVRIIPPTEQWWRAHIRENPITETTQADTTIVEMRWSTDEDYRDW